MMNFFSRCTAFVFRSTNYGRWFGLMKSKSQIRDFDAYHTDGTPATYATPVYSDDNVGCFIYTKDLIDDMSCGYRRPFTCKKPAKENGTYLYTFYNMQSETIKNFPDVLMHVTNASLLAVVMQ